MIKSYFNALVADYNIMAREALRYRQLHAAVQFFTLMSQKAHDEESKGNDKIDIFGDQRIRSQQADSLLLKAIQLHDETLQQDGEIGPSHRCREKPFGENITYLHDPFNEQTINVPELFGRSAFTKYLNGYNINNIPVRDDVIMKLAGQQQSERLCTGRIFQVLIQIYDQLAQQSIMFVGLLIYLKRKFLEQKTGGTFDMSICVICFKMAPVGPFEVPNEFRSNWSWNHIRIDVFEGMWYNEKLNVKRRTANMGIS